MHIAYHSYYDIYFGYFYIITLVYSMIIFLNGATSSGKTTIAKAIQDLDERPWLLFGIDTMISMMPSKYWSGGKKQNEGFYFSQVEESDGVNMRIECGEFGNKLSNIIPDVACLLDKNGFNLIIDEVIVEPDSLKNYANKFSNNLVYFIGVYCNTKIIEEREILRADRCIGSARDQIKRCHKFIKCYDLKIDTSQYSASDCAKKILNFIAIEPRPKALKEHR